MNYDELPLGDDELAPAKPYTAERAEEIAEINGEIASLFAEINSRYAARNRRGTFRVPCGIPQNARKNNRRRDRA